MRSRDFIRTKAAVMSRALEELAPTLESGDGENPIVVPCGEMPAEADVLQVLALLEDVFYPGYRSGWAPCDPIETLFIERLDEAYDVLYRQVMRALPLRPQGKYAPAEERGSGEPEPGRTSPEMLAAEAERIVGEFFARLPAVREMLKEDVRAAYRGDPAARSYGEIILSYPGLRAITTHRVAHELYRLDVPLIPRLMNEHIHARTGIDIHPGARIGHSFFIDHGTGVVIGETTEIGDRVRVYHGVTLGARSVKVSESGQPVQAGKRHPTIEDDVVIYPGATILGGDTVVGKGAVVGGNVFLMKSVPPHTTVLFTPGDYATRTNAGNPPLQL